MTQEADAPDARRARGSDEGTDAVSRNVLLLPLLLPLPLPLLLPLLLLLPLPLPLPLLLHFFRPLRGRPPFGVPR